MPIIEVEIVLRPNENLRNSLAQEISDSLGTMMKAPPGSTWVKVKGIPNNRYAESGGRSEDVFPIFVTVLKSSLPAINEMQVEVDGMIEAISRICDRSRENIHVIYLPEGRGRVAFGGKVVK